MNSRMRKGLRMLGVVVILGLLAMTSIGSRGCFGSSSSHHVGSSAPPPAPWTVQLGTTSDDVAEGVATDTLNNIYVAGWTAGVISSTSPTGGYDLVVVKYNPDGVEQWARQLGSTYVTSENDKAYGVATDTLNNIYVAGRTSGVISATDPGGIDLFVVKYNSAGEKLWARQFGSTTGDEAYGVATDTSDNIYVAGATWGVISATVPTGGIDLFVVKYNSDGDKQWARQLGSTSNDKAYGVATDLSDNVYVVGYTDGGALTGTNFGGVDFFVVKYNTDGDWQWTEQLGTGSNDFADGVVTDDSGNVYVVGCTGGALIGQNQGSMDLFVVKYNTDGVKQWTEQLGTTIWDAAQGVAIDTSGPVTNIYVAGFTQGGLDGHTNVGGYDLFVVKYDSTGEKQWTRQLGSTDDEVAYGVATDLSGNVYAAGYTEGDLDGNINAGPPGTSDIFVAKISGSSAPVDNPPTVIYISPADGEIEVGLAETVTATFSEPMDASTISVTTFTVSSTTNIAGTVTYNSVNRTAAFTPSALLSMGTTYTVTITTGVKDLEGNPMVTDYIWTFTAIPF